MVASLGTFRSSKLSEVSRGGAAGPAPACRFPRVLVSKRLALFSSAYCSTSAAQSGHPTNRLGERPCLLRLDRHSRMAYRWSCAAQRVTFLSSCASVRHTDASSTRFARVGRCDRRAAERPSSAARPAPGELWVRGSIIAGRVSCSGWFGRCSTLVAHVYLPSGDNHCPPCIRLRYVVELHHQTIACAGLAPGHDGVPSRSFSRLFQTRRKTPST